MFDTLILSLPTILSQLETDSESRVVNVLFRLFGINGLIIHGNLYRDGQCTATMHSLFESPVFSTCHFSRSDSFKWNVSLDVGKVDESCSEVVTQTLNELFNDVFTCVVHACIRDKTRH